MQYARPHDCRAKIGRDFCAYILVPHIRTSFQCKKYVFFTKLIKKMLSLREKFPKLDIVLLNILLHCERSLFMQCIPN